jgi:cysteinyl-tRNA synthetase
MGLKLYNTLTRKKEIFKPIKKGQVGMYVCGPTVYWYQHIGNMRAYLFSDVLRRVLEYNGLSVKEVMNVTDVGHLTSDADEGEDKLEKAAKKEKKTAREIADFYWEIFREDFKKLNIEEPSLWTKATDYIPEQIKFIEALEKKGFTYNTKDGVYFDTSKIKDYGKLAKLNIEGLQAGKRINVRDKKNKTDFALWKFSEKKGVRQQEWDSPWGVGFPGWHLECSVMGTKEIGKAIDIHTGGIDHIPIHHTNERAQNIARFGKPVVKFWLHNNFLTFGGEKVSKSKGGLFTISELEKKGFSPLEYRYFTLSTHYRKPLNFSLEQLKSSQNSLQRLRNIISDIKDDKKENKIYLKDFEKAINDDLNLPDALQVLWKLARDKKAKGKLGTIKKMDEVFGLGLLEEKVKVPKDILKLVKERETARANKDWAKSDLLRDEIGKKGFVVDDTGEGSKVREK